MNNDEYMNNLESDIEPIVNNGGNAADEIVDTQPTESEYKQDSLFPLEDEYDEQPLTADEASDDDAPTILTDEYDEITPLPTDDLADTETISQSDEAVESAEHPEEYTYDQDSSALSYDGDENDGTEANDNDDTDESDEKSGEAPDAEEAEPEVKLRRVDTVYDFVEIAIFSILGMFLLLSFFFRYTIVDGGSMMNTLQHNERLLLSSFLYTPERGDIVVVQDKSTDLKDPIVKRVIAVGGETVKITRTAVYVDTILLDEPYVYTGDYVNVYGGSEPYRYSVYPCDAMFGLEEELGIEIVTGRQDGVYYEIYVPEGYIFLMGDHRNNSKDSRDIGLVHEDAVIGKAVYRFFPFDKIGKIE